MIIGLFLRHYKSYRKLNYLPFVSSYNRPNLNLIIGNNGSGKSSVLEALDVYFNRTRFILTHNEKRQEGLISPIFLFEKSINEKIRENTNGKMTKKVIDEMSSKISDFLWSLKAPKSSSAQMVFEESRDKLGDDISQDSHLLLIDGVDANGDLVLSTFEELKTSLIQEFNEPLVKTYFYALRVTMKYVYIPVETSITDYLRLESEGIQSLMATDVKTKIDDIFEEKITKDLDQYSIIGYINKTLKEFVEATEKSIQGIESDYSFTPDHAVKQRVTSKDLRGKVIDEFFRNRQLKRSGTKIENLSSGQRKQALVDIIYALLTNDNSKKEEIVIVAIDEPEASLHVNNCFDQFEKLQKISGYGIQTFITTHWYGALPIIDSCTVTHVLEVKNEPPEISIFDSSNLYDNHDAHRIEDINFKSIYDLASSILSSLRTGNKSWLIVEGNSDRKYLECYLAREKIKILSVGGIDRLIALVDFLSFPLRNKDEKKVFKNRIMFLSDNDLEYKSTISEESNVLFFKRYIFKDGGVKLVNYSEPKYGEALSIEDVMDAGMMWKALHILSEDNKDLKKILKSFELENDFKVSKYKGDYSFLKTVKTGREKIELFDQLEKTLNPLKTILAIKYKEAFEGGEIDWINSLKKLLKV